MFAAMHGATGRVCEVALVIAFGAFAAGCSPGDKAGVKPSSAAVSVSMPSASSSAGAARLPPQTADAPAILALAAATKKCTWRDGEVVEACDEVNAWLESDRYFDGGKNAEVLVWLVESADRREQYLGAIMLRHDVVFDAPGDAPLAARVMKVAESGCDEPELAKLIGRSNLTGLGLVERADKLARGPGRKDFRSILVKEFGTDEHDRDAPVFAKLRLDLLADPDVEIRKTAIYSAMMDSEPTYCALASKALDDTSPDVVAEAMMTMEATIRCKEARQPSLKRAKSLVDSHSVTRDLTGAIGGWCTALPKPDGDLTKAAVSLLQELANGKYAEDVRAEANASLARCRPS
jgi:hypothetical protein